MWKKPATFKVTHIFTLLQEKAVIIVRQPMEQPIGMSRALFNLIRHEHRTS